jgi:8-amino-3,8-dideoxy-alpha-D-manno-octulosonate transaminase
MIIEKNRHNKQFLINELSKTSGITFSKLPDPSGDSATFLNMFLPDTEAAKRTVNELNKAGVGGFNYWFENMYHFINQWDHIKEMRTASKLTLQIVGAPQDYSKLQLPRSQEVIGRLISFGIRCKWTDQEMKDLASKISVCVTKALKPVTA